MKSLSLTFILIAGLGLLSSGLQAEDRRLRDTLLIFSTYMAPEITTYGPYTTVAGSVFSTRITEALENISYDISVDSRIDKREIFALRDDSVDYVSSDYKSQTFKDFCNHMRTIDGAGHLSDLQIASYIIGVASFL